MRLTHPCAITVAVHATGAHVEEALGQHAARQRGERPAQPTKAAAKMMTAAMIYQLQEEGKLSTSDLLSKWLPDLAAKVAVLTCPENTPSRVAARLLEYGDRR